jgi:hypothetical protein
MSQTSKKPIVFAIAGGIAALLIAGYMYASSAGVKKFEDFLYDNDLSDSLRYDEASYSPLSDTITLEDVELEVVVMEMGPQKEHVTGRLDSLSIEGASVDNKRRIAFSGYELVTSPSDGERQANVLYQMLDEPLKFINRMGIEQTRLDGSVAYDWDRDDENLELGVSLDAENIASYSINLRLSHARRLVDIDPSTFIMAALMNPKGQLAEFGKVEFVSLNASVKDYGFMERLAYLDAISRFDYGSALNNDTAIEAVAATQVNEIDKKQMAEFLDEDSIEAVSSFRASGGDLKVSVETRRPVRFSDLVKNDRLHRDITVDIDD